MKIHEKREEVLVAVCDEDLLGEKIVGDDISLSIRKKFYGSHPSSEEKVIDALKKASICNLVGEKSVGLGVEVGVIERNNILEVDDVPHAQMVTY